MGESPRWQAAWTFHLPNLLQALGLAVMNAIVLPCGDVKHASRHSRLNSDLFKEIQKIVSNLAAEKPNRFSAGNFNNGQGPIDYSLIFY